VRKKNQQQATWDVGRRAEDSSGLGTSSFINPPSSV
jgi:hypothetical protein